MSFSLGPTVLQDASYLADDVRVKIEDALLAAFSFDQLSFGRPATAAEIVSVIHQVEGVIAVDLDALYSQQPAGQPLVVIGNISQIRPLTGITAIGLPSIFKPVMDFDVIQWATKTQLTSVLPAEIARRENGDILPAQLLLINESGIDLTMKSAA